MAEITNQIILSTLQTAGLLIGIFYYVTTLINAQKTRELTLKAQEQALETRHAQLFMQIYQDVTSAENLREFNELMEMEWEDYDDFMRKYGKISNPNAWVMRHSAWSKFNGIGHLVKAGLIDSDRVYDLTSWFIE